MKRILINEEQEKIISEALRHKEVMSQLPVHLLNDIKHNNTSISDFLFFNTSIGRRYFEKMVLQRFNDIKDYFSDDVSNVTKEEVSNKLDKLIAKCIAKEEKIRPQLEELCFNVISQIFTLTEDSFNFECHLVDEIDQNKTFDIYPQPINFDDYSNSEDIDVDDYEIQKRRILNAMVIGGSMRLADKATDLYLKEVFKLDEELPHLYSRIIKLNEFYIFLSQIKISDKFHQMGGYVETTLATEDDLATINANAIIFPILLTESIRGFMELFASFGLPDGKEYDVMEIADALIYEPWDMRIGPALFDSVFKHIVDLDSNDIPYIFSALAEVNTGDFLTLIKECIIGTEKGANMLKKVAIQAIHDKEYEDFENKITQKQIDNNLLSDGIYV